MSDPTILVLLILQTEIGRSPWGVEQLTFRLRDPTRPRKPANWYRYWWTIEPGVRGFKKALKEAGKFGLPLPPAQIDRIRLDSVVGNPLIGKLVRAEIDTRRSDPRVKQIRSVLPTPPILELVHPPESPADDKPVVDPYAGLGIAPLNVRIPRPGGT